MAATATDATRKAAEQAQLESEIRAAKRLLKVQEARDSLIEFTRLTMPDPHDPADVDLSMYEAALHHEAIAEALEKVERGEILRLIITMPPRHGKSELASKRFPVWCVGRNPSWQIIFATYNQDFADDFGRKAREIIKAPSYRQVFPGAGLKPGSAASNRLELTNDALMVFVGMGGAVTGRGADLLVIDDPFKNAEDADSQAIRDKAWSWFTTTAFTRLMPGGRIVIILTRWHEDDIVGRIDNPEYIKPEIAATYKRLDLPAISHDGQALWPERYPLKVLEEIKGTLLPREWAALYQQQPAPEDGDFFKRENIVPYHSPADLPKGLRMYGASDHAVSTLQTRDATVAGCVGVCPEGHIWILPDLFWGRKETDFVVDEMIAQFRRHKPLIWWAERGHISKSIGPFLRKAMTERGVWANVEECTPVKDKQTRARSIQGMMAWKRVHFPAFAPWYGQAVAELLKFPNAAHDDFVDWLAWIGLGVEREVGATLTREPKSDYPKTGTLAWVKWASNLERKARDMAKRAGGF